MISKIDHHWPQNKQKHSFSLVFFTLIFKLLSAEFKACFAPSKSEFSMSAYTQELREFVQVIKSRLSQPLKNKKELFARIDEINHLCLSCSANHPKIGVMIEGSVYHLLQNLMMCSLHYPHNDISALYIRCVDLIAQALDKCVMKYSLMRV